MIFKQCKSKLGKKECEKNCSYVHVRLAAERRRKEQREARRAEKRAPILNKMEEYKAKESATMEMFKKMAEEQRRRGNF